ncbi:MAG: helix-turn-helix domain-containing protein [Sphingomicrobium sp.]
MDEELVEAAAPRVGERLRAAREEAGISLEDVAAQTRIPQRHLESIETSEWDKLPAPTYTIGFAKSYAGMVGLDRAQIGEQLREEMGGQRFTTIAPPEVFEPADPARAMPRWLVLGAILAIVLVVVVMSWLNRRALQPGEPAATSSAIAPAPPAPAPPPAAAADGAVILTATGQAWIQVSDQGTTLFEGELAPGQSYTVPSTAVAPLLKAGKPESLRINVGNAVAPQVGPSGKVASTVSLKPADLMRGPVEVPAASPPPGNSTG